MAEYTDPALRQRLKEEITQGDRGGDAGRWSARKAQLLAQEYERAGGGYSAPGNGAARATATDSSPTATADPAPTATADSSPTATADTAPIAAADPATSSAAVDGAPFAGYERATAREVLSRLGELSPAELETLRDVERAGKARKTVLDRVEKLLG